MENTVQITAYHKVWECKPTSEGKSSWVGRPFGRGEYKPLGPELSKRASDALLKIMDGNVPSRNQTAQLALFGQQKEEEAPDPFEGLEVNPDSVVSPDFIHEDAELILGSPLPKYRIIGRPKYHGTRYYAVVYPNPDKSQIQPWTKPVMFPGTTSVIKKTLPTSDRIGEWMVNKFQSYDEYKEWLDIAATKGTIMHGMLADLIQDLIPELDSREWRDYVDMKITKQKLDPKIYGPQWNRFFQKSLMSFIKWVQDYEVKFIFVEIGLVSLEHQFGGQIDFFVEMNEKNYSDSTPSQKMIIDNILDTTDLYADSADEVRPLGQFLNEEGGLSKKDAKAVAELYIHKDNKNDTGKEFLEKLIKLVPTKRKRILGIVDAKSGENSHDSHVDQLGQYRVLVGENFPNLNMDEVKSFNWHPSDFNLTKGSTSFSYKFHDQTKKISKVKTAATLAMYKVLEQDNFGPVSKFVGKPTLDANLNDMVTFKDFIDNYEEQLYLSISQGLML